MEYNDCCCSGNNAPEESTPVARVIVWPWWEAPDSYRALSRHGGDEDWVAWVSPPLVGSWWQYTPPMVADISEHPQDDGSLVLIGAHA